MDLPEKVADSLAAYREAWNKAEGAIKIAEQVNAEIVNPAIYELRYGGRRVVEAIAALEEGNEAACVKLLADAHFDCSRARHDAIDAATTKMVADINIAIEKLGPDAVRSAAPDIHELIGDLGAVRDLIANSRENREDRDAIYASIEQDHLRDLAKRFRAFQANDNLMKAFARRRNIELWFHRVMTALALIVAVVSWIWAK